MGGEVTSNKIFENIQMITSGKPFINHSGFCSVRMRTAFFRERSSWLGRVYVLINTKGLCLFRSNPSAGMVFPTFKTVLPFNIHKHAIVFTVTIFVIKGNLFESAFNCHYCVTSRELQYLTS